MLGEGSSTDSGTCGLAQQRRGRLIRSLVEDLGASPKTAPEEHTQLLNGIKTLPVQNRMQKEVKEELLGPDPGCSPLTTKVSSLEIGQDGQKFLLLRNMPCTAFSVLAAYWNHRGRVFVCLLSRIELRASHLPGRCCATELLYPWPTEVSFVCLLCFIY